MLERPPNRKYTITHTEIWDIIVNVEMQGGNKIYAYKINKIIEEMIKRHDN